MMNYYLQKAERIGEILLPAASHMLLSLQFLKQKQSVCYKAGLKCENLTRWDRKTSNRASVQHSGQPGATAHCKGSRQLSGKTNEPSGHVLQRAVCTLQRR